MASRLMRRSGVAVALVSELLGWEPDWVIQVGVGKYHEEIKVMQDAWPNVQFIGFEPHPDVYRQTVRDYPGYLLEWAIGDRSRVTNLYSKPQHQDGSSLFLLRDAKPITVRVKTLDESVTYDYLTEDTLLWLDCEGAELDALRGGERTLDKVAVVNVEMTANPVNRNWCKTTDVHDHLVRSGFLRQWVHTTRSSAGQYDAIYVKERLFKPQYCCCPFTLKEFYRGKDV